jgi:hypothetical protein
MPAAFVDQVQKLDIRAMLAAAFKAGPSDQYRVCCDDSGGWHPATDRTAGPPVHELVADITLDRPPAKGELPRSWGKAKLKIIQPDGRSCEQVLWLIPTLTRNGRLNWTTLCPRSDRVVQVLYFSHSAQRFVSRQFARLKYRQKRRKIRNYRLRMFAIMRELEATHSGPWIPKPVWMIEPRYQALMKELIKMDIRRLCAVLKRPEPNFGGEPLAYAEIKPQRVHYPPATVLFYVKKGVRQLKARYRPRYGLPPASLDRGENRAAQDQQH